MGNETDLAVAKAALWDHTAVNHGHGTNEMAQARVLSDLHGCGIIADKVVEAVELVPDPLQPVQIVLHVAA